MAKTERIPINNRGAAPAANVEAVLAAFAAGGMALDPMAPRDDATILNTVYLLRLIRAHPNELTHGADHAALRGAVRELLDTLPRMIAAVEDDACATRVTAWAADSSASAADWAADLATVRAVRAARKAELDQFTSLARALLAAAQSFARVARAPRTSRGWWHGWAGRLAWWVALVLHQHGRPHGMANAQAPVVVVTAALLDLAGVKTHKGAPPDVDAVVAALRAGRRARKPLAN
jgi:hypothetical protein